MDSNSLDFEEMLLILERINPDELSVDQLKRARKAFDRIAPSVKSLSRDQLARIAETRAEVFEINNTSVTAAATKALGKARKWYLTMSSDQFTDLVVRCIKGARLDGHYCGWNENGTIYSGWDNLLRDAQRIERLAARYDLAVERNDYRRPSLNKTGKPGKQSVVDAIKNDPMSVYSSDAQREMLAALSGVQTQEGLAIAR
jgi:hypothetical protein